MKNLKIKENRIPNILYHSTNKRNLPSILKDGLKVDHVGFIYLMEKPINFSEVLLEVSIPNKNELMDWKEAWLENGEEIDSEHQYDKDNPYWIYLENISPKYINILVENNKKGNEEMKKIIEKLTIANVKKELDGLGISIEKNDDEFIVNFKGGKEATAYYTNDLEDALGTGKAMVKGKKKESIIEIKEEVQIGNIILEEGDKIEVLKENNPPVAPYTITSLFKGDYKLAFESLANFVKENSRKDILSLWLEI